MMLGARTAAWAKSGGGLPTARDYVQDGLVAMWDGIENSGWGVHSGTNEKWVELISLKESIKNSDVRQVITLNDGFRFVEGGFITNVLLKNIVSIEAVLRVDTAQNSGPLLCSSDGGIQLVLVSNADGVQYVALNYTTGSYKKANVPIGKKFSVSIRGNVGFTNGIDSTVVDSSLRGWGYNYGIGSIAYYLPNNFQEVFTNFVGDIHSLRCYSRHLTIDEIAANYAIDKTRFNLP